MKNIFLSFIPVFFAVDVIGTLPMFLSLTQGFDKRQKSTIIRQSVITAICLSIGFIFAGTAIFTAMGVSVSDFMIAGGMILFCIALMDIIHPGKKRRLPGDTLGVVPLGTPLIAGPAVLTTSLIIINEYGLTASVFSVIGNILLAGGVFYVSDRVIGVLGDAGTRALSKVTGLFLAAIAVMMIRKGFLEILTGI